VHVFWWLNESPHWTTIFSQSNVSLWAIFVVGLLFLGLSHLPLAWQAPNKMADCSKKQKWLTHLFAASLPLLLFWLLYHLVLNTWWSFDDPDILRYIDRIGPIAGFFDPSQKYNFYTPLQHFSLGIDYGLFGLNPTGFYWHHLLSLSVVILLAYLVLSLFFAPLLASMIVSLFVVAVPTAHITHFLMVRHYVEGLALSLIAVSAYVQAVRQERWAWAGLGSLFYLLATMAKELYVPLVIALVWLPIGTVKTRLRLLIPYIIVAILYTLLRIYMLGEHVFSGYSEKSTTWLDVVNFPTAFINVMGWHALWQWLIMLGIASVFSVMLWQRRLTLGLSSLVWFGMAFIPLIPIMWRIPMLPYYLFVFVLLFYIGCGIALNHLGKLSPWRNALITGVFLALLLTSLLPVQTAQFHLHALKQAEKTQGEFLMYNPSSATVLIYDYPVATSLIYLRNKVLSRTEGVKWCPKEDCLCTTQYPGYTAKQYVNGEWQTKTLSPAGCGNVKKPLSVIISLTPDTVNWHFGPYPQGQGQYYAKVTMQGGQAQNHAAFFPIQPQGTQPLAQPLSNPVQWIVKYVTPDGQEIYSAPLLLEPTQMNEQGLVEVIWHASDD